MGWGVGAVAYPCTGHLVSQYPLVKECSDDMSHSSLSISCTRDYISDNKRDILAYIKFSPDSTDILWRSTIGVACWDEVSTRFVCSFVYASI